MESSIINSADATSNNDGNELSITFEVFISFLHAFLPNVADVLLGLNIVLWKQPDIDLLQQELSGKPKTNISPPTVMFENYVDQLFEYISNIRWQFKMVINNASRFQLSLFNDVFVPTPESTQSEAVFDIQIGLVRDCLKVFRQTQRPLNDNNTVIWFDCVYDENIQKDAKLSRRLKACLAALCVVGIIKHSNLDQQRLTYIVTKLQTCYVQYFSSLKLSEANSVVDKLLRSIISRVETL